MFEMKKILREEVYESNRIALADDMGNEISFYAMALDAVRLFDNVAPRSIVLMICDGDFDTYRMLYELLYMNCVPYLVPEGLNDELLMHLIDIYQPAYIYCRQNHLMSKRYDRNRIAVGDTHILLQTGFTIYPVNEELALLLSTSGSTGSPKLVKFGYQALYNHLECACKQLKITASQRGTSPLPLNYVFGLSFTLKHWHCGASIHITNKMVMSKLYKEFMLENEINNFAATPYTYEMLLRVNFWDENVVNNLNYAMSGGISMPHGQLVQLRERLHTKLWNSYGQTECLGLISTSDCADERKIGSVGRLLDNIEGYIDNETGELVLTSDDFSLGYATCREELLFIDGNRKIYHSGDIAEIDEDGYIYIRNRISRIAKILGARISLDDLEEYLQGEEGIEDIACIGGNDQISIFYVSGEEDFNLDLLNQKIEEKYGISKEFITWNQVEVIPRNTVGKKSYSKMECRDNG